MKAIAKCPKCSKVLETNCRGCIEGKIDFHKCKDMKEPGLVQNISWKLTPENESDLEILERGI